MPDRCQEVVLADHTITVPDLLNNKIEDVGLDYRKVRFSP